MKKLLLIFCAVCLFASTVARARSLPAVAVPFPNTEPLSYENGYLHAATFPKTVADLSFTDRMALKSSGYEPFMDMRAYRGLVVEGEEHFIERQMALMEIERMEDYENMERDEYCDNYPLDTENCDISPDMLDQVIAYADDFSYGTEYSGVTIGGGVVVANNKTRGGSCYPAATSRDFKNQVLTTGQYETVSPAFEKAMITVFRKEGKCGYIPGDPCGYTCYGIGQNCTGKTLGINVRSLTRPQAEGIYYKYFWQKYNVGILPDVISGDVFLAMMASGPCTGIYQFRKFLGLPQTCNLDDTVVAAVQNYNGDIHNRWLDVRKSFLVQVAARKCNNRVLNGWMRSIRLKRENGCHVIPATPLYRQ